MILRKKEIKERKLIPLGSLKQDYLRVDFEEDDNLICDFINQSIEDCEDYIQYPIRRSDVKIQLNAHGSKLSDVDSVCKFYRFQKMKVNDITSIKKTNTKGDEICLEEGKNYRFDKDLGTIYWINNSEVVEGDYCFIDIEADIGWECTNLPTNIKMAIVELTSLHYDMREIDVPIPAKVLNVLAKHRYMA